MCYLVSSNPSSNRTHTSLHQKVPLGNPYPIAHYVTGENFTNADRYYLATITKVVNPRFYHEAVKVRNCREAMATEIQALEINNIGLLKTYLRERSPLIAKGHIRLNTIPMEILNDIKHDW